MIVVDTELSGLDADKHSLLSIGAVELEHPENQFYGECRTWDGAVVEDKALEVNGFSREEAVDPKKQTDRELLEAFLVWAEKCKEKTLAGQFPTIDTNFLQATAKRHGIKWPFMHLTLDLHSMAYLDQVKKGIIKPGHTHAELHLNEILVYVGLETEKRPHNGLNGAKLEAEAFSRLLYGKNLLEDYKKYPILAS